MTAIFAYLQFCETEITVSSKSLVWQREINRSISILLLFGKLFRISLFCGRMRNKRKIL
jgi:hypothetical protein